MMKIMCIIITGVLLLPFAAGLFSCRKQGGKRTFRGLFRQTAGWILKYIPENPALAARRRETAARLYPGIDAEGFCRESRIRKTEKLYGALVLFCLLLICSVFAGEETVISGGRIARGLPSDPEQTVSLLARSEDGQEQQMDIVVKPRQYSDAEREQLFERARKYIDSVIKGQNSSLDQVKYPLVFPDRLPGENVSIIWECEDYSLVGADGRLGDLSHIQLPAHTTVKAVVQYGDYKQEYEKKIRITEYIRSQEQKDREALQSALTEAEKKSSQEEFLQLPDRAGGKKISWVYEKETKTAALLVLCFASGAGFFAHEKEKQKKLLQARRESLSAWYPVFVHKMVLMLSCGMTVRRSWQECMLDLGAEKEGRKSWLYREMYYSWLQMQTGQPEIQVYQEFGERADEPGYAQFVQLLVQRIRQGNKGMQDMMLSLARSAQNRRREIAKQRGETAGTRLLLPMIMLLVVVLSIVMFPALLSM